MTRHVLTLNFSVSDKKDKYLIDKLLKDKGKSVKFKKFAIIGLIITEQLKEQGIDLILDQDELRLGMYQNLDISRLLKDGSFNAKTNSETFKKNLIP